MKIMENSRTLAVITTLALASLPGCKREEPQAKSADKTPAASTPQPAIAPTDKAGNLANILTSRLGEVLGNAMLATKSTSGLAKLERTVSTSGDVCYFLQFEKQIGPEENGIKSFHVYFAELRPGGELEKTTFYHIDRDATKDKPIGGNPEPVRTEHDFPLEEYLEVLRSGEIQKP